MAGELESTGAGTTVSLDAGDAPIRSRAVPGVVLIFAQSSPQGRFFRVEGGVLELGRSELAVGNGSDPLVSRNHVRVTIDETDCSIADLGSRNGTFVNGERVMPSRRAPFGSVVRVGGALLMVVSDLVPFEHYGLGVRGGIIAGPALRLVLESIARVAQSSSKSSSLLISGETGTGKEIAARTFHEAGGKHPAALTAVNCATIPRDLAERLLFGSRRGAFSGATDSLGYLQSAQGGTLFLDEIAELSVDVQSKLLRTIETREVLRLGAIQPERIDVRLCAATWRDLRAEVGAGRFREDLYFRIGQPEVRLPALRDRLEEIPWHVQQVLDEINAESERGIGASAGFLEACTLRHWPGNVRELRGQVRRAALTAAPDSSALCADDLETTAGVAIVRPAAADAAAPSEGELGRAAFPEDEIAMAMASEGGNVASAARRLGIHRNKVRRWLERHRVDARQFKR
jgi:DNA-binding NtrC family response regulator